MDAGALAGIVVASVVVVGVLGTVLYLKLTPPAKKKQGQIVQQQQQQLGSSSTAQQQQQQQLHAMFRIAGTSVAKRNRV